MCAACRREARERGDVDMDETWHPCCASHAEFQLGAAMAEQPKKNDQSRERETTRHKTSDTSDAQPGHTGAGQEAAGGKLPEKHDTEHQSNYGGGGTHGGSK